MLSYPNRVCLAQIAFGMAFAALAMPSHAGPPQLPETGFDLPSGQKPPAQNQPGQTPGTANQPRSRKKKQASQPAEKEAIQPDASIPVTPLGFAPPAAYYLGERFTQASLGFLDENHLLFTFRVPGLIPRAPGADFPQNERRIRAVSLSIADGKVTAESLWSVHDYDQYLWIMKDGKFLLRDRNLVQIGDASLHLEPFLRFPGSVHYLEFDPSQQLLVTNTTEPPAPEENPNQGTGAGSGSDRAPDTNSSAPETARPATASASMIVNNGNDADPRKPGSPSPGGGSSTFLLESRRPADQNLVRILSLSNRKVLLFSRTNGSIHIPVDGDGYYESLRGNENKWMVSFEYFTGATVPLAWVDSTCDPALDALAPGLVLASACTGNGARRLTAILRDRDKDHTRLWDFLLPPTKVWPILARSADGLRFARATLDVTHPVNAYNPLDNSDMRGQSIQVYDAATGQLQLTVPANPILDGGGNFALSPSGTRLAVLNSGNIEVFNLPPPPPIPSARGSK